jgi:hypothetical protein
MAQAVAVPVLPLCGSAARICSRRAITISRATEFKPEGRGKKGK